MGPSPHDVTGIGAAPALSCLLLALPRGLTESFSRSDSAWEELPAPDWSESTAEPSWSPNCSSPLRRQGRSSSAQNVEIPISSTCPEHPVPGKDRTCSQHPSTAPALPTAALMPRLPFPPISEKVLLKLCLFLAVLSNQAVGQLVHLEPLPRSQGRVSPRHPEEPGNAVARFAEMNAKAGEDTGKRCTDLLSTLHISPQTGPEWCILSSQGSEVASGGSRSALQRERKGQ